MGSLVHSPEVDALLILAACQTIEDSADPHRVLPIGFENLAHPGSHQPRIQGVQVADHPAQQLEGFLRDRSIWKALELVSSQYLKTQHKPNSSSSSLYPTKRKESARPDIEQATQTGPTCDCLKGAVTAPLKLHKLADRMAKEGSRNSSPLGKGPMTGVTGPERALIA